MHVNPVDIWDDMDYYTDLKNQSATNAGENVRYIHTRGLSQSMWGLLRLAPINI